MTRYTVAWDQDVEVPFMHAWLAAHSELRASLTEIANWVDRELATDPDIKGQPHPKSSDRVIEMPRSNLREGVREFG